MEKDKAISESTVNSQRIGITLKLETIKNFASSRSKKEFYSCSLFHFISENEIIHILMYFIETRHLGLEQESAKCNQERTNLKQGPLQHLITFRCFKQTSENTR